MAAGVMPACPVGAEPRAELDPPLTGMKLRQATAFIPRHGVVLESARDGLLESGTVQSRLGGNLPQRGGRETSPGQVDSPIRRAAIRHA